MAPQDDLTAERAAAIAKDFPFSDHEGLTERITEALKTARQEALREATGYIRGVAELAGKPEAKRALYVVAGELDRLASEGG